MILASQLTQVCPSATALKGHNVSERYSVLTTSQVVHDLEKLGWNISSATEIKAKKRKGFQKHMVRLRHSETFVQDANVGQLFPEIIITNSSDGRNAFVVRLGFYRTVCSNGLIVSDKEFAKRRIIHKNYSMQMLHALVEDMLTEIPAQLEKVEMWRGKRVSPEQTLAFYTAASKLRNTTIPAIEMQKALRAADEGDNAFVIFNRVQEHLLVGGMKNEKGRKMTAVKSMNKNMEINQKLWDLAGMMLN